MLHIGLIANRRRVVVVDTHEYKKARLARLFFNSLRQRDERPGSFRRDISYINGPSLGLSNCTLKSWLNA